MWATADWWNSNFNGLDDPSAVALRWLNASNTSIRYSSSDLAAEGMQAEYWFRRNWSSLAPAAARSLEVSMRFDRTSGTNNDGAIDDLVLKIITRE